MREWTGTLYHCFADQDEAQAQLAASGITPPDSLTPRRSFCALVAGITEWETPPGGTIDAPIAGIPRPGFWTMMKLDQNWSGFGAAMAVLEPFRVGLNDPGNVFLEDPIDVFSE